VRVLWQRCECALSSPALVRRSKGCKNCHAVRIRGTGDLAASGGRCPAAWGHGTGSEGVSCVFGAEKDEEVSGSAMMRWSRNPLVGVSPSRCMTPQPRPWLPDLYEVYSVDAGRNPEGMYQPGRVIFRAVAVHGYNPNRSLFRREGDQMRVLRRPAGLVAKMGCLGTRACSACSAEICPR
jgi:hypothetical protein